MNLGLCIGNLLQKHPAVEVPGIGVFSIVRQPASYDKEQRALLPPTSRIELIRGEIDCFPIVDYVKEQRNLDEANAVQEVENVVGRVIDTVTQQGQAILDGLGYLVGDKESFIFKPFETNGVGPQSVAVKVSDVIVREEEVREEEVTETEDSETEAVPKNYTIWWIAAAVVLLAAGGVWFYQSGIAGGEEERQTLVQHEEEPIEEIGVPVDSVADSLSGQHAQVSVADSTQLDTVVAIAPEPVRPAVTYEIIVGSFATMAQAHKYVTEMKAKGYDLRALDSRMPGNRKKISWGSYDTEEEAYRELTRVQKTFEPGAWIAKIENK